MAGGAFFYSSQWFKNELRTRLQDLADGRTTVDEVEAWIGENFISVPEVDVPDPPDVPPVDVEDLPEPPKME